MSSDDSEPDFSCVQPCRAGGGAVASAAKVVCAVPEDAADASALVRAVPEDAADVLALVPAMVGPRNLVLFKPILPSEPSTKPYESLYEIACAQKYIYFPRKWEILNHSQFIANRKKYMQIRIFQKSRF